MQKSSLIVALGITLMGASSAMAGPSTHELGRVSPTYQGNISERQSDRTQPYRLTGTQQREVERRMEWRQLPQGRGQFHWVPFIVNVER